ncbi:hypothetical protein Moror_8965 [Moniliophthora roreri MCA 2997]|uniref:Uncharacterized protein n=2 Tax=Moniliophthora roreri TaxID=221103 RepID=V2XH68_MONRO|nr:hypothetical protein Moror_8965 [Moniliophthora roreri MCA 2997]KAI3610369.1 hypothetical protein WG66_007128 [Moniliophthora roreri]
MAAIYTVYTSPTHPPIPNHLPTLIVTPHGQPSNILYSYLHTNYNTENYLLTPSPQGDLCVAKLFPPRSNNNTKASASDPGHSAPASSRVVRCEASRNLKWSIANTGVISPIYKLSLPSPDSPDLPLFQISKPNPNAAFWSMFYFAYAGHNIPPKRIEFGKIQKNPPGPNGGGTRISITGKTPEEKAVWQTLGEGNEDCVEWVVLCAALNLLDDEILKAAEKTPGAPGGPTPVSLRDPGPASAPGPGPGPQGPQQRPIPQHSNSLPPGARVGPPPPNQGPPRGYAPGQGPPPPGHGGPMPPTQIGGYGPGPGQGPPRPQQFPPGQPPGQMPPQMRGPPPPSGPGQMPPAGYGGRPPPQHMMPPPQQQARRF